MHMPYKPKKDPKGSFKRRRAIAKTLQTVAEINEK